MVKDYALRTVYQDFEYFIGLSSTEADPSHVKTEKLMDGVTPNFGKGHSYGMLGLPGAGLRNKLLVSDAIYSSENIGPPVREPGICRNRKEWRETMEYILKLAKNLNAEIWYGHDNAQFKSLIKSTEGWYE